VVFLVILAPTIPKDDDVAVILEPEPSPRVPEEPPATVRPVPTGMCHCHYVMKFLRTQAQLKSFKMFIWNYFVFHFKNVLVCYFLICLPVYLSLNSVL
jgi:hypothetical protein